MRISVLEPLERFLQKGDLKIDHWFKELRSSTVIFSDANAFANVNTPEELQNLEKMS
jgi:molybdopterin-guanine dinucleotide biosynthesis protein A